jgi:hypothetical protein
LPIELGVTPETPLPVVIAEYVRSAENVAGCCPVSPYAARSLNWPTAATGHHDSSLATHAADSFG